MKSSCAYSLVLWLSLVQALLGLAIIAVALYTLFISIGVGCGLLLVSLVSCCGSADSRRGNRKCLFVAFALSFTCVVIQIVSVVLFHGVALQAIAQTDLVSGSLVHPTQVYYNNAMLSTYVACCTGCTNDPMCTKPVPNSNNNCLLSNGTFICEYTKLCVTNDLTDNGCVVGPVVDFPPVEIGKPVCDLLGSLELHTNIPLVSHAYTVGGCGQGHPEQFVTNVFDYFGTQYNSALIALGVMCALQAMNTLAQLVMIMTAPGGRYGLKSLSLTAPTPTSPRARNDW
ncbi:hypothetical protein BASA81_008883 [Batrachochytrium salamandrivorans]|nr:hypothetical protein BASA81_008883 [Batrachochytrium salamandrivorans]